MVVCHCLALNDAVISDLARTTDASIDSVVAACGAGTRCGGCRDLIAEVLDAVASEPLRVMSPA